MERHWFYFLEGCIVNLMDMLHGPNFTMLLMIMEVRILLVSNIIAVLSILCNPSNHFFLGNYADIFFELLDDGNLLQDPNANNPVVIRLLSAFY